MKKVEETERDFRELCDACHNQHVVGRFTQALGALKNALAAGGIGDGADTSPTRITSGPVVQQVESSGKK